jgi:N-acyl-D-amino-acid deacylase
MLQFFHAALKAPILAGLLLLLSCLATGPGWAATTPAGGSFLIHNVQVFDGSGRAPYAGAVRVDGAMITGVGELEPEPGERLVDGGGLALAPGFIDTHSHVDDDLAEQPDALAAVSQGITTAVVGQDGGSPFPLAGWFAALEANPAPINLASYAGHNTLREQLMGGDANRPATAAEIEAMSALLQQELDSGALGLASGLEYEPGIYSDPAEVIVLAKVAAAAGGRYISHLRSEDRWLLEAVDEIINIGREAGLPVQISHLKLAMKSLWGTAPELLARLDQARDEGIDITADVYPYTYWQSNMMVLIPSRDLENREEFAFALAEIAPAEGFWLTRFAPQPDYVGKKLTEIAALRGVDEVTAYMQLAAESLAWEQANGSPGDMMIGTSMVEEDVQALLAWPHSNVCTDGSLADLHPRGAGSFPRVLGRYVREQQLMPLAEAVHKMSGLSAAHMGITDRGRIFPGQAADLVLFNPDTVLDQATPEHPGALSTGIQSVWVNGQLVFDQGAATGLAPGRIIRRTP